MINWLEKLMGETQARMLTLLRRSHQSITTLAKALRLTDNAVRSHIAVLRQNGIVKDVGVQRDTGGKPARMYGLTQEGEEIFPKAYALALSGLVEEISRQDGRERLVELLRAVGARAAASVRGTVPTDKKKRVESAATVLRSLGADVDIQSTEGGWRLQGYACPFSAVTTQHAEVCELARSLVSEIVGQPVEECCERNGHTRCAFVVES
jgi:predicted ArsR family transcriptional regulator